MVLSEEARRELEARVAAVAGIKPEWLMRRSRARRIAWSRFLVWTILYKKHGVPQTEIGRLYDKHPSTVGDGIRRAELVMGQHPGYAEDYGRLAGDLVCPSFIKIMTGIGAAYGPRCGGCGRAGDDHET